MPSIYSILCRPLLLPPSIFPSIRVFSSESVLRIRWPKYWSFSFTNSPSNEYSGLISFRLDWLDFLAVQESLKSLLQKHSSKTSKAYFFIVQLLHPYIATGKTIALTRRTFVGNIMSLLFMLSRLVITFLPRNKCLLISWLQSLQWFYEVAQSRLILCDPMDCSLPGSSVHGILQARVLEWVAFPFSRGSSQPWDWTQVSLIAGRHFTVWATREALILEPRKIKSVTVSTFYPSICLEVMGPEAMILVFWILCFKPTFPLSSFTLIKRLFSSSLLLSLKWYHLCIWGSWYFS